MSDIQDIQRIPPNTDRYKISNIRKWTSYEVMDMETNTVSEVRIEHMVQDQCNSNMQVMRTTRKAIDWVMDGEIEREHFVKLNLICILPEKCRIGRIIGNCPRCRKLGMVSMLCKTCTSTTGGQMCFLFYVLPKRINYPALQKVAIPSECPNAQRPIVQRVGKMVTQSHVMAINPHLLARLKVTLDEDLVADATDNRMHTEDPLENFSAPISSLLQDADINHRIGYENRLIFKMMENQEWSSIPPEGIRYWHRLYERAFSEAPTTTVANNDGEDNDNPPPKEPNANTPTREKKRRNTSG